MTQQLDFYSAQVASCGASADASTLANQRQKFLDAQSAWQALADRELKRIAKRVDGPEPSTLSTAVSQS